MASGLVLWIVAVCMSSAAGGKVNYAVECQPEEMTVSVQRSPDATNIYLDKLKGYPGCHPEEAGKRAIFRLSLTDIFSCGTTRVVNKLTGRTLFYHRIVVEHRSDQKDSEVILVKCSFLYNQTEPTKGLVKRDVLPAEFEEPEFIEITSEVTGKAPIPILSAGVRQNGQLIDTELNIRPGAPLVMEVFLDSESAGTYGVLVSDMVVSDTKNQEEILVINGCSVDPYLFENFNTLDGDFLTAQFRAFKFPESNYVLFKGTINVCLDRCSGIKCSNGQLGYGRRRRSVVDVPADPNKVFEVTMTTFIRVDFNSSQAKERGVIGGKSDVPASLDPPTGRSAGALTQSEEVDLEYTFFDYSAAEQSASSCSLAFFLLLSLIVILFHQ